MRFIKPAWLTHGGERKAFEVYSCHVSPDGTRLVTAAGDGHVRVWSVEAIKRAGDPSFSGPKQLASMSYHSGTIHTVRFSSNGRYLASGADDKIVCVYTLDPNAPSHASTFGSNEPPPVESWRIFRRLIGHDNDVQDLGWSYDSSILVSVGLDSKVVVWSGFTFEKLKTLSNHQSHVKGITFDPANKYFATASDDRTIKIFRFTPPTANSTANEQMNNFMLETTIVAPFASSPLTTYFRRCSWSPEGIHIAAANAVNGPVSSVAIINRGTWDSDINLIGHEGPVEVCAFSPRLFNKDPPSKQIYPDGKAAKLSSVIACAGQDKALSVWNTSHPRPLMITQDLAAKSLSDLAWTPDGQSVFVTSLDGSIIAVVFDEGDLGYVTGEEENEKSLAKFGGGRKAAGIIESTEGLLLEEKSKAGELRGVEGRMGELMGDGAAATGKDLNGNAGPTPMTGVTSAAVTPSADQNGTTNGQASDAPAAAPEPPKDPAAEKIQKIKQRITITKDGKKRLAPMLVSASGTTESSLPKTQLMAAANNQGPKVDAPHSILDLSKPFDGLPKGGLATLLLGNKRRMAPVEDAEEEAHNERRLTNTIRAGGVPILTNETEGLKIAEPRGGTAGQEPTPDFIRPAVTNPTLLMSQIRLAVPRIRAHIHRPQDGIMPSNDRQAVDGASSSIPSQSDEVMLEARNPTGPSATGRPQDRDPSRITLTKKGQILWQDFLPRSVILVTGNQHFWCAACEDGAVFVWTPAGRRINSPFVLEAQPVILECFDWWLLCITSVGMCYVWNIEKLTSPHPPVSLAPILDIAVLNMQPHPSIAPAVNSARLNSQGNIIVTLNNGDGYTYAPNLFVWQRLTEPWWAVGSQYWNTTESSTVGNLTTSSSGSNTTTDASLRDPSAILSTGIIPYLERSTTAETLLRGRHYFLARLIKSLLARDGFEGFESTVSVAHLENRLAAALQLGARDEFRVYLAMYAKRLGAEGARAKVEELLKSLLGRMFRDDVDAEKAAEAARIAGKPAPLNGARSWYVDDDTLCGWSREELLKEVVLILGKHRDLHRTTVPYAHLLGVLDEHSQVAPAGAAVDGKDPDAMES